MSGQIRFHDKNDEYRNLKLTKRAAAKGKMHTWTIKKMGKPICAYRCLVCDFVDFAIWPRTPDPREPYCPQPKQEIMEK